VSAALVVGAAAGPLLADATTSTAGARARSAEPVSEATPLTVQLTSMTPAVIPAKGALLLRGVVTNASQEDWTDINVAPFLSAEPITTRDELVEADATAADATVGTRLSDPATYVKVGDLLPGRSTTFAIKVPRTSMGITGAPGVYWIGVHALGSNSEGRDLVADGRARTFIPLVAKQQHHRHVNVSLLLPLRERARRADDGSLNGPSRWAALTGPEGRLTRLAEFAASAGSHAVTWEVDPAVLDALEDFGRGNPPLSLGPKQRAAASAKSPSPSATPSPTATESSGAADDDSVPDEQERARATQVLQTFLTAVHGQALLAMPYADVDAPAMARSRPSLLTRAQSLSARRLKARGLDSVAAVAPPDAEFDPALLSAVNAETLFVLGDRGNLAASPYGRLPTGQPLVLTDERASASGPRPSPLADPLTMRQRILSEAALDLGQRRPIVVRFPMRWQPGAHWREADFFGGLTQNWWHLVPVEHGGTSTYDGKLAYGRTQRSAEIGPVNIATTRSLVRTGDALGDLLTNVNDVRDRLTGAALQGSAYSARPTPRLAADQVRALDDGVRARMNRVQVTGTDFVTLSSGSGTLTVTPVNDPAQPINVGVRTRTDSAAVKVESAAPVQLGPGQRTTVPLVVHSPPGVHEVTMVPVTGGGQVAGAPLTFSLRTSQVGQVLWYVIAAGCLLLAVTVVRRIVLRIRNRQWRLEEQP
jgi:Family of unknown function (DUF6049)